jgi:hypothetical protein
MTVQDDLRRLSQLDGIYLGWGIQGDNTFFCWHEGRLQQANNGNWIFRSVSSDSAIIGWQLGNPSGTWTSSETPSSGLVVQIPITEQIPPPGVPFQVATVFLQQQLPQELTN